MSASRERARRPVSPRHQRRMPGAPVAPGGKPARRRGKGQGRYGQANVLQLAKVVLGLSPMNSVADQMSPLGSANEAL